MIGTWPVPIEANRKTSTSVRSPAKGEIDRIENEIRQSVSFVKERASVSQYEVGSYPHLFQLTLDFLQLSRVEVSERYLFFCHVLW